MKLAEGAGEGLPIPDSPLLSEPDKPTKTHEWLIPLAPADQHLVGSGLEGGAEPEQAVESGVGCTAAIEAEHETVEVGLEVLRPQAVVDAQGPPLRVREHAM